MAAISVNDIKEKILTNPLNVEAWSDFLEAVEEIPVEEARAMYNQLIETFPTSPQYWTAFIRFELSNSAFAQVEELFRRCLLKVLHIDVWKIYLTYVRDTKSCVTGFKKSIKEAYEFALDKIGLDFYSYSIYHEFIRWLLLMLPQPESESDAREESMVAITNVDEIRKVFLRGISCPIENIAALWRDYEQFEKKYGGSAAQNRIDSASKVYSKASDVAKCLEKLLEGINTKRISVPLQNTVSERLQLSRWHAYLNFEKSNPLATQCFDLLVRRVIYAYEQALMCFSDCLAFWCDLICFLEQSIETANNAFFIKEVDLSEKLNEEISRTFERAMDAGMKDEYLIYFVYSRFLENQKRYSEVKEVLQSFIQIPNVDPTLAYIHLMQFANRTGSLASARAIFKSAREDERTKCEMYIAAAEMEYRWKKDPTISVRTYELGLKRYKNDSKFACSYLKFVMGLNEDSNTRVLFERILSSGMLNEQSAVEVWNLYVEFESLVGDLATITKVNQRRQDALTKRFQENPTAMLVDRYKFMNLLPCKKQELDLLGYMESSALKTEALSLTRTKCSTYPDIAGLLPYKPRECPKGFFHYVAGGIFPPPAEVAKVLSVLPPPGCFHGPFVKIDDLFQFVEENLKSFKSKTVSSRECPKEFPNYKFASVAASSMTGFNSADDLGALVLDPGHHSFRIGYAGDDNPKLDLPGVYGYIDDTLISGDGTADGGLMQGGGYASNNKFRKYFIGTNAIHVPRAEVEYGSFLQDGLINDWDMFENVVMHAFNIFFMDNTCNYPILFSEASWNTRTKRERLTEVMFEKFGIPAFYVSKNSVLAAFANGRQTAIVLDSGATHTTASPVYDGFCMTNAIVKTSLGGIALNNHIKKLFQEIGIEVIPKYMVKSKQPVAEGHPARWKKKKNLPEVTSSFHDFCIKEVLEDFKASVCQVSDAALDPIIVDKFPRVNFEFPNGFSVDFGRERFEVGEALFDLSYLKGENIQPALSVSSAVHTSVNICDSDYRTALYNSVVVTGGNSLLPGFVDRFIHEVNTRSSSNAKVKIHSAVTASERRFGAWIGGSILASLANFQQMWISKQEYEETGRGIVEKKCP
ncbi:Cleavage stimulation factor subunit 3 [Trichinella pseudospiralis]|uniref:Cleavage stimulation factor subunit 3 n=1 Tax=Trichinella pseudospiralis TaxID=6337 RepID=A0A0V0XQ67_TRIPS|nr:Cleavage stimulation factor subunit 3 [Trichinella pseudospiralis]KRX90146.1 Cleavage stimulation factor subunit 3 [Trichinella pseudospiralis]